MPEPFLDSGAGLPDQGRVKAETELRRSPSRSDARQAGLDAGLGS